MKGHGPSILVASLSAAFGVGLLQITGWMGAALAQGATGNSNTAVLLLQIVAIVFIFGGVLSNIFQDTCNSIGASASQSC